MDKIQPQLEQMLLEISKIIQQDFPNNKEIVSNVGAISQVVARVTLKVDSVSRKLGLDFLCEAERDIKSCTLLYSKKIYPHATYHLQQGIEKATKAYVLLEGFVRAREMREIMTHDSPSVFLIATLEKTGIKELAKQLPNSSMIAEIVNAEDTMGDEEKRLEIAKTSYDDVSRWLSAIDQFKNTFGRIEEVISSIVREALGRPLPPSVLRSIPSLMSLAILGVISFPHEAYTRYPERKMVPNDYTRELGIVRATPKMVGHLKEEIDNLKRIHQS